MTTAFRNQEVDLRELHLKAGSFIYDLSFRECLIKGPEFLKLLYGCDLLLAFTPNAPAESFVRVEEGGNIRGATVAIKCDFIECYFPDLSFVGTPQEEGKLLQA